MKLPIFFAATFCLSSTLLPDPALAQGRLAQLYAPRPPEGSAFVRLANPRLEPLTTQIAGAKPQAIGGEHRTATRYAIVRGDQPFNVVFNETQTENISATPGSYTTIVVYPEAGGAVTTHAINDTVPQQDAMKATLRFYNLAVDCPSARLFLDGTDTVLFKAVEPRAVALRAINPVKATLAAACGSRPSSSVTLPTLRPGDHFNLFLTGNEELLLLKGQLSETDPLPN